MLRRGVKVPFLLGFNSYEGNFFTHGKFPSKIHRRAIYTFNLSFDCHGYMNCRYDLILLRIQQDILDSIQLAKFFLVLLKTIIMDYVGDIEKNSSNRFIFKNINIIVRVLCSTLHLQLSLFY